jgi:transcription antitermination factor NusA-like protein
VDARDDAYDEDEGDDDDDDDDDDDEALSNGHCIGCAVFRVLCAAGRVGGLIGKNGANVKAIVREVGGGVRVKVLEGVMSCPERAVLIVAPRLRSRQGDTCAAKVAAMKVVRYVTKPWREARVREAGKGGEDVEADADEEDEEEEEEEETNDYEEAKVADSTEDQHGVLRILVPAGQAGHLIGKGGENIRDIRRRAHGAHVAVQEVGQVPMCATSEDRVVEIHGTVVNVCEAAELIFDLLRGFLVAKSVLPHYEPRIVSNLEMSALPPNFASDPAIVNMSGPMPMQPMPMQPMPMQPMHPMYVMAPVQMVESSVDVDADDVQNVIGESGANIAAIAQISGCQVAMIEPNPETNISQVELKGPHVNNIAAAKSLISAFASGNQPVVLQPQMPGPGMAMNYATHGFVPEQASPMYSTHGIYSTHYQG